MNSFKSIVNGMKMIDLFVNNNVAALPQWEQNNYKCRNGMGQSVE